MSLEKQTRIATLVPGTGFGGRVSGIPGLQELGKLGLNPGTDRKHRGFPQVVKARDFCAGDAIRRNFERLTGAPTTLSVFDLAQLRDDPASPAAPLAAEVFVAMSRALSDVMWWLWQTFGVERFRLGGGILQGATRRFVLEEMIRRAATVGLQHEPTSEGVRVVKQSHPSRWQYELHSISAIDSAQFLKRASDHARDLFAVVSDLGHRGKLFAYLPLLAMDDLLAECQRRFPREVSELSLIAGDRHVTCLVPIANNIPDDLLELCCVYVFCKLQNLAMLGGYSGSSNLEGDELPQTLARSELPERVQTAIQNAYRDHGFAILIESYRGLAVTRQSSNPALTIDDRMAGIQASFGAPKVALGLDIGAQSWKALVARTEYRRLKVSECIGPYEIPSGCTPENFFTQIAATLRKVVNGSHVQTACIAWPGVVDRRGPCGYSGILGKMAEMPNGIATTEPRHLDRVNVPELWHLAWPELPAERIGVINDGVAFDAFYSHRALLLEPSPELPTRFHGAAGTALVAATL